jgi:hypothetical protein
MKMTNSKWIWIDVVVTTPILLTLIFFGACSSVPKKESLSTEAVLVGIKNQKMQEVWKQSEGKLPPIEKIPVPVQRVSRRERVLITEAIDKKRPVIPPTAVVDVQLFSEKPVDAYDGILKVTSHKPGILIGTLEKQEELLELHYKLPGEAKKIAVFEHEQLRVLIRDEVVDSAMQRIILIWTVGERVPFLYLAEGSGKLYKKTFTDVGITIEQIDEEGNPPVKVTYYGKTITLKQGERKRIGEGTQQVEVFLVTSLAMSPKRAMLQEGQPYSISLLVYKVQ